MDNEFNSYDFSDVVPEKETTIRNTKCCQGCTRHANKLHTYDWLHDFPEMQAATDMVTVSTAFSKTGAPLRSKAHCTILK